MSRFTHNLMMLGSGSLGLTISQYIVKNLFHIKPLSFGACCGILMSTIVIEDMLGIMLMKNDLQL